jgi:hypothetical protein
MNKNFGLADLKHEAVYPGDYNVSSLVQQ